MSGQPTLNIVDDEEMSSQGSVNAPVAAPRTEAPLSSIGTQSSVMPSGLPLRPQSPVAQGAPTLQSSVGAGSSGIVPTVPVAGGLSSIGTAAPTSPVGGGLPSFGTVVQTTPVDVPSRQETKKAFEEVSSAFQGMTEQHGQMQGDLQTLASTVAALKQAQQGEAESSAQVQATLQRTASVASDLEARLGVASMVQEQSRVTAEQAQRMSQKAIEETQSLQFAQQKTAAELRDEVMKIGFKIQEQAERTLLQEQTLKEQQKQTTEQLSQKMQSEVDSTKQQAVEATQLAVQAQSVAQFASTTVSAYETRMNQVQSTVEKL